MNKWPGSIDWKTEMISGSNKTMRMLAMFFLLTGCASTPQQLTEESKKEIRNIAIVSLVPENVNFDKIGVSSFTSKYTEFDMGDKVTGNILYVSRERIAKSQPGWVAKNIVYDRTALLDKVSLQSGFVANRVKEAFADLALKNDLDAIFVVRAAADREDDIQQGFDPNRLGEGLSVLIKNDSFSSDPRLVFRANLGITVIGKNGEVMAACAVPAKLDSVAARVPDDYDVSDDMKHNHRPEVLEKVGAEVVVDLARRLNLCFDTLGFGDRSNPEAQHVKVIPQAETVIESTDISPAQAAPAANAFDRCFSKCRQYTDRTKEQCFDACNK